MIFYNNQFIKENSHSRLSQYGDGIFETIRLMDGEILFFYDHIDRMFAAMNVLKMNIPQHWNHNYFYKVICELLEKNNMDSSSRIRINVWRESSGKYLPETNSVSVSISSESLADKNYIWNSPIKLGVSKKVKKSYDNLSNIKSSSALLYVVASLEAKENNLDDVVILNSYDKVADATSSNIFIIKDNKIITPSLRDAGVAGVMRKNIIDLLNERFSITEQSLTIEDVTASDEIFLTNVMKGIQPVHEFNEKSYTSFRTKEIFDLLLESLTTV
jgi:branched-chain amino acid aminotransferase